jgi:hypothetical protein
MNERQNEAWAGVLLTSLIVAILLVERGTTWERCSCLSLAASWAPPCPYCRVPGSRESGRRVVLRVRHLSGPQQATR